MAISYAKHLFCYTVGVARLSMVDDGVGCSINYLFNSIR